MLRILKSVSFSIRCSNSAVAPVREDLKMEFNTFWMEYKKNPIDHYKIKHDIQVLSCLHVWLHHPQDLFGMPSSLLMEVFS